jgi:hypothetical protein
MDKYEFFIENNAIIFKYISALFLGFFTIILIIKIISSSIILNFSDFRFLDLLSLILALFSMSLSAAFFFKSTDQSNQFYNSSVEFTQNISEILGRIEGVFGERLKHLDEGYQGIRNAISPIKEEIKFKQEEIKNISEKSDLDILTYLEQNKIDKSIIKEVQIKLKEKDEIIKRNNDEIKTLSSNIENKLNDTKLIHAELLSFLSKKVKEDFGNIMYLSKFDTTEFRKISKQMLSYGSKFLEHMRILGYMDDNYVLTEKGKELLVRYIDK